MEALCGVSALAVLAALPLLLYYLTRQTPPNVGPQRGGGVDGALGPIYGYPPLDVGPKPPLPSSGKQEKPRREGA